MVELIKNGKKVIALAQGEIEYFPYDSKKDEFNKNGTKYSSVKIDGNEIKVGKQTYTMSEYDYWIPNQNCWSNIPDNPSQTITLKAGEKYLALDESGEGGNCQILYRESFSGQYHVLSVEKSDFDQGKLV